MPTLRIMRVNRQLQRLNAAARPDLVIRRLDAKEQPSFTCIEVETSPKSTKELS